MSVIEASMRPSRLDKWQKLIGGFGGIGFWIITTAWCLAHLKITNYIETLPLFFGIIIAFEAFAGLFVIVWFWRWSIGKVFNMIRKNRGESDRDLKDFDSD
jgi:hypothetical protein